MSPGVSGKIRLVNVRAPPPGKFLSGGSDEKRPQALLSCGVRSVVRLVHPESPGERLEIALTLGNYASTIRTSRKGMHRVDNPSDDEDRSENRQPLQSAQQQDDKRLLHLIMLDRVKTGSSIEITINPTRVAMTRSSTGSKSETKTRIWRSTWTS